MHAEAVKVLDQRRDEIVAGKYHGRGIEQITLRDLLKDLETDDVDRECSSLAALRSYQKRLVPSLGNFKASNFRTGDLNEYKHRRLTEIAASGGKKTTITGRFRRCGLLGI